MPRFFKRFILRHYAGYLRRRYDFWNAQAVEILRTTGAVSVLAVMPLLPRYLRRAAACDRLLQRYSPAS